MKDRTDEPLRQDAEKLANACNEAALEFNHNNALDMLKLVCFNDVIHDLHTHSYSFQTATGRNIINTIQEYYYEEH